MSFVTYATIIGKSSRDNLVIVEKLVKLFNMVVPGLTGIPKHVEK